LQEESDTQSAAIIDRFLQNRKLEAKVKKLIYIELKAVIY
jgi:hypothetical protein